MQAVRQENKPVARRCLINVEGTEQAIGGARVAIELSRGKDHIILWLTSDKVRS